MLKRELFHSLKHFFYEVLSAITKNSIKKEDAGVKAPRLPIGTDAKKGSATSSTISVADFLYVVKDY